MNGHRRASRLTSWLFVAALLVKSAVPMLASAAATLQGRATAEVCDVYGVDMSKLAAPSAAPAAHAGHEAHDAHHGHHAHDAAQGNALDRAHDGSQAHHAHDGADAAASALAEGTPSHGPASRVAHGGDHCALSALAFALASAPPNVVVRVPSEAPVPAAGATTAPVVDPAARWAAQLQHAPPRSS